MCPQSSSCTCPGNRLRFPHFLDQRKPNRPFAQLTLQNHPNERKPDEHTKGISKLYCYSLQPSRQSSHSPVSVPALCSHFPPQPGVPLRTRHPLAQAALSPEEGDWTRDVLSHFRSCVLWVWDRYGPTLFCCIRHCELQVTYKNFGSVNLGTLPNLCALVSLSI